VKSCKLNLAVSRRPRATEKEGGNKYQLKKRLVSFPAVRRTQKLSGAPNSRKTLETFQNRGPLRRSGKIGVDNRKKLNIVVKDKTEEDSMYKGEEGGTRKAT